MRYTIPALAVTATMFLAQPAYAAPGDMDLATFVAKADRLEKRGPLALVSSDFGKLKKEVEGASADYRGRIVGDKKSGKTPHSCPPPQGALTSDELLKEFRAYPASQRAKLTVRSAFFAMMKKRYPCN